MAVVRVLKLGIECREWSEFVLKSEDSGDNRNCLLSGVAIGIIVDPGDPPSVIGELKVRGLL